jgi:hypothetical protein
MKVGLNDVAPETIASRKREMILCVREGISVRDHHGPDGVCLSYRRSRRNNQASKITTTRQCGRIVISHPNRVICDYLRGKDRPSIMVAAPLFTAEVSVPAAGDLRQILSRTIQQSESRGRTFQGPALPLGHKK